MLCCAIPILTLTYALTLLRMLGRFTGARSAQEPTMPPTARRTLTVNGRLGAVL